METQHMPIRRQFKLLWKFMYGNRHIYAGAIVAVALSTVSALIGPLILRATIDSIIGDAPIAQQLQWLNRLIEFVGGRSVLARNLWICSSLLVILALVESLFLYLKGKWSAIAAENAARTIREQLYDHLQSLPYEYHIKAETGDLVQRCTSDVETIRRFLATQFVEI